MTCPNDDICQRSLEARRGTASQVLKKGALPDRECLYRLDLLPEIPLANVAMFRYDYPEALTEAGTGTTARIRYLPRREVEQVAAHQKQTYRLALGLEL